MEREGSVERLAIFDVMSGASDSRTDPRKPDIVVLLRRGPRLRRRELPRLSKRKATGLAVAAPLAPAASDSAPVTGRQPLILQPPGPATDVGAAATPHIQDEHGVGGEEDN